MDCLATWDNKDAPLNNFWKSLSNFTWHFWQNADPVQSSRKATNWNRRSRTKRTRDKVKCNDTSSVRRGKSWSHEISEQFYLESHAGRIYWQYYTCRLHKLITTICLGFHQCTSADLTHAIEQHKLSWSGSNHVRRTHQSCHLRRSLGSGIVWFQARVWCESNLTI